jgi:Cu/Ag efflux protein CusF
MIRNRYSRLLIAFIVAFSVAAPLSVAHAQSKGKTAHTFRGKVEKVDAKAKTMTVNGEKVEGWMGAMTMAYSVDKEDVLTKVKAGDQITAKVYDGDFKTLYDVQVLTPPKK